MIRANLEAENFPGQAIAVLTICDVVFESCQSYSHHLEDNVEHWHQEPVQGGVKEHVEPPPPIMHRKVSRVSRAL